MLVLQISLAVLLIHDSQGEFKSSITPAKLQQDCKTLVVRSWLGIKTRFITVMYTLCAGEVKYTNAFITAVLVNIKQYN